MIKLFNKDTSVEDLNKFLETVDANHIVDNNRGDMVIYYEQLEGVNNGKEE